MAGFSQSKMSPTATGIGRFVDAIAVGDFERGTGPEKGRPLTLFTIPRVIELSLSISIRGAPFLRFRRGRGELF